MSRSRKSYQEITYEDLASFANKSPENWQTFLKYKELEKQGENPRAYYSVFNGLLVREGWKEPPRGG